MKYTITLVALSLLFVGCDTMSGLQIKARKNASVKIYGKETLLRNDKYTTKKTIIQVPDSSGQSQIYLVLTRSDWNSETVSKLMTEIDSIVFSNKQQTRVLKNRDELYSYLMDHRRGFDKGVIKIKAR